MCSKIKSSCLADRFLSLYEQVKGGGLGLSSLDDPEVISGLRNGYRNQVYAGVLGKVVGVYMGRPFEGWHRDRLVERWGFVDRYVNGDVGVPLVVSDDDISGTLTFVRALEDSGRYGETCDEFFGDTWLNYLIEGKTVLWWGGMGHSTEHTAYLRLKDGYKSPESGSIGLNGKTVAEQIGAQIFIDGFGMACPGAPGKAAELARKASGVSHDGEAMHAAVAVAVMESAAFVVKDMETLLDLAMLYIPKDSLIAQLHRDVRQWCKEDGNWHLTYDRINEKYGYHIYGGNCHVIPNHALMVMAWSYAPDDFRLSQAIVNTAGWDTDCNAANVGCLMGLVVGAERISEKYDFVTPMAGRIILPTADGTYSATDCWTMSGLLARIGCGVMGWKLDDAISGQWMSCENLGLPMGFQPEVIEDEPATLALVPGSDGFMAARCEFPSCGGAVRMSMPVYPGSGGGGYGIVGTSKLYSGMDVVVQLGTVDLPDAEVAAFVRYPGKDGQMVMDYGEAVAASTHAQVSLKVPETKARPIVDFGLEFRSAKGGQGNVGIKAIDAKGEFAFEMESLADSSGWILDVDFQRGAFSEDREALRYIGKNKTRGFAYIGNRWWRSQRVEARLAVHLGSVAGVVAHVQGLQRYVSLTRRGDKLVLARQFYGEEILAECPCDWKLYEVRKLALECKDGYAIGYLDGVQMLKVKEDKLQNGAAGFIVEKGLLGIGKLKVSGYAQAY